MGMVRVALAVAVLLSHLPLASYKFLSGGLAVHSFFIVSGFYMSLVLGGKYKDTGLFYSNRLLRLFPTYFAMCALGAVTLWVLNASPTGSPEIFANAYANPLTAAVLVFENIFMVGQEMLFWFSIDDGGNLVWDTLGPLPDETTTVAWQGLLIPQSWSLSMEIMFYALAPFLARLDWRWIAAIAAASIGLRLAGHLLESSGVDYLLWQGRLFPTGLFLFLLGMLGHRALPLVERLPKALGWIANAILLSFIVTFPLLTEALALEPLMSRWVVYAVVALSIPFVFHAFKDVAFDRWIGDLSYPIYLSQLMVIGIVLTYEPPFAMWAAIVGTFAVSALVLVLIDHPVDRWRQRRIAKFARAEPGAAPGAASVAPL